MAGEKAKIAFYQIDSCGYYAWREQEPAFGELEDILNQLQHWGAGKQLAETKTYEVEEGATELPTYLFDLSGGADDWLLTTWNETESSSGQTASVLGTSSVGNPQVTMRDIPEGGIPGFATYFWIIPSLSLLATVRFQHRLAGKKSMQQYIESYLATCSDHVVYTAPDQDTDVQIAGYQATHGAPARHLTPRFATSACRIPSKIDTIRRRIGEIRKVIKKTTLDLNRPEELSQWQALMRTMKISEQGPRPDEVKVRYEVNTPTTEQDLDRMIEQWQQDHSSRRWDDYGFVFRKQSEPIWLSDSIAKGEFELDIARDNIEVVNAESLLRELRRRRDAICSLLG